MVEDAVAERVQANHSAIETARPVEALFSQRRRIITIGRLVRY
jgi:hypothetical protein